MSASPNSAIKMQAVSRIFETKSDRVVALDDVSVEIGQGDRVALLGRSGSGKSTLLNLLGGLDRPTAGSIVSSSKQLDQLTADELAAYRLHSVGMVFQAFHLIRTKTALQNVEIPFVLAGISQADRRKRAMAALESVGLKDRASHRPTELSGGEQQRVAIARALANQPAVLLADEPTGNLDSKTAAEIMEFITHHSDEHKTTVILVTHDEELASTFANRTLRMRDGKLEDIVE